MLYGLFLGADGKVWTYVPPTGLVRDRHAHPNYRELASIRPRLARWPAAEQAKRDVAGQEAFEFFETPSPPTTARWWVASCYGLSSEPAQRALNEARLEFRRTLLLTLGLLLMLGVAATLRASRSSAASRRASRDRSPTSPR